MAYSPWHFFMHFIFSKIELTNSSEKLRSAPIMHYNNFNTLRSLSKKKSFDFKATPTLLLSHRAICFKIKCPGVYAYR